MPGPPRRVLWTACACHAAIHVFELAVPALLLLIQREFGAGDFQMGRLVALYGLLFGLGALPAGVLVDRLGSRAPLMACMWGSGVALAGMALAPGLGWLAVWASLLGVSLSVYHPAGTALIAQALPLSGRTFAMHGMAGNLGVACSAALAGGLGALLGWRGALGALALGGAALGVLAALVPGTTVRHGPDRSGGGAWGSFALLLVAVAFLGIVYRGVLTFLPKLFAETYGGGSRSGTAIGGALTTLALLVGLAGMFTAGRAVDRGARTSAVFLAGALGQGPFLVAVALAGGTVLLPLMMATAFFHFFTQPAGNHMVAELVPPRLRGLGYGLYFAVAFGVGSSGAVLGGWISERAGLARALGFLSAALVPGIVAAAFLARARLRR